MSQPRPQRKPTDTSKKVIFNAAAVARHLGGLKAAAEAAGEEGPWWADALAFDWTSSRKGANGTQWLSVTYTDNAGVSGRLVVRISGERHTGQIMPNTDQGVAELAMRAKNPKAQIKKRDRKPTIQIQKWAAQVKTADDGITVLADADGRPILPDDDKLSPYFQVASLVGEAFTAETSERVARGVAYAAKIAEMRRDKTVTPQAIIDAFNAGQGARRPADTIMSSDQVTALRKGLAPKDLDVLLKGVTVLTNTKVTALVQEFIGDKAEKNAGQPLPNPMTRIAMNFENDTGRAQLAFFDKSLPFMEGAKQSYEVGKVDGEPINADNIHKFVLSRSLLDGIVNMDSICFSSMGISMPVKAEVLVVKEPAGSSVGLDDVYEDADGDGDGAGDVAPAPAPAGPKTARPAARPPPAEPAADLNGDDIDDLVADLGVTG